MAKTKTKNPILQYHKQIQSGKVVVSKKVKKVYEHLVRDIINNPDSEYIYDDTKANHVINFIQRFCRHSKGAEGGKLFILELWQKALLSAMFGIVHKETGNRKFQQTMLLVGRKSGKSALSSAVGLYLMLADQEAGAEIYSVASKRDQAKIIWQEAKRMVQKSPALKKRIKTRVADMVSDVNDSSFIPLGRDSNSLDGLNSHCALMDEIHSWTDQNLYDVIADSLTAREQPMIFITTTAGTVRENVYDTLYSEAENIINGYEDDNGYVNERFLPIIYELDAKREWTDETKWAKANPSLGTVKSVDQLRNKVNQAKQDSIKVKNLITKDFNLPETSVETFLDFETIQNQEKFDIDKLKPDYIIGGVDLSQSVDLTSATALFMLPDDNKIYVKQMNWLPEDVLEKRVREDKVPYDVWRDNGWLRVSQGNKIDYRDITKWFLELQEEHDAYLYKCGYDSWSAQYFVEEMADTFGNNVMEAVIQGKKTLSSPMYNLKADMEQSKINYNDNPVLKWCMSNVAVEQDKNLNIQPSKGKNQKKRIDGFASLLDAYTVLENNFEEYQSLL